MNILIYDCEIIKAVPVDYKKVEPIEGIEYCEGWKDFDNMGISVIGAYLSWEKEFIAFTDEPNVKRTSKVLPLSYFQEALNEADVIVGFNHISFDNNLIKANGFEIPTKAKHYDILVEMWAAVGLGPEFVFPHHAGFSLDQTCKVNGIGEKTGTGANAAVLWQRGHYQEVIDYCLHDVRLTLDLLRNIQENDGWIMNPKTKIKLPVIKG